MVRGAGRRRLSGVRWPIRLFRQRPRRQGCLCGPDRQAYVAFFRALLVPATRLQQTTLLRQATDRTVQALSARQEQAGPFDQDEVTKCVRFLSKVTRAREALALALAREPEATTNNVAYYGLGSAQLNTALMSSPDPDPIPGLTGRHRSATTRKSVFLCHSSADKTLVRELYHRLVRDGLSPWLDEEDLLPAQNWESAIREAVRSADCVVVCLSAASTTRAGYVQKEIRYILDVADEQPEGTTFVIPARLEVCSVPDRLSHLQWVDLFADAGYDRLAGVLASAVRPR